MKIYCLKCNNYTKNINPQVSSTSNGKTMMILKCKICNSRKCKFVKKTRSKRFIK